MARKKANADTPIFPQEAGTAEDAKTNTETGDIPAFPDMQNLNRETADKPEHGDDGDDGDDWDEIEDDSSPDAPKRYICHTECFYNNDLVRVGASRYFVPGTEPPHFRPAGNPAGA